MTATAAAVLCCCGVGPPGGCEDCDPVTVTWTGSCSYIGECCPTDIGGATFSFNCSTWTCSHSQQTSPEFPDLCAASAQRLTGFTAPEVGSTCGADNCDFDPSSAVGCRLRFRLERDDGASQWSIRVESSGDVPSLCPNEAGGTGWSLRFVAAMSGPCPPASGWFHDVAGSTMPIVGSPVCGDPLWPLDSGVSSFSVGTVTVTA